MLNWLSNKEYRLGLAFVSLVIFNITVLILWRTPASTGNSCVVGYNLSMGNVFFALVISLLLAINVIGVYEIFKNEKIQNDVSLTSLGGVGFLMWILSTVCFACYLPIVSILGFNFTLNFLNVFAGWAQFLGIALALVGVLLVDRQIRYGCWNGKCKI